MRKLFVLLSVFVLFAMSCSVSVMGPDDSSSDDDATTDENNAPTVSITTEDQTIYVGDSLDIETAAEDPDKDELTYSWSVNDTVDKELTGATFTFTSDTADTFTITVTVSDGTDTASDTVTITVEAMPSLSNGTWYNSSSVTGFTDDSIYDVDASGQVIIAGTFASGVHYSEDGGSTWSTVSTGLPDNGISSLHIDGDFWYIGTTDGLAVYDTTQSKVTDTYFTGSNYDVTDIETDASNIYVILDGEGIRQAPLNDIGNATAVTSAKVTTFPSDSCYDIEIDGSVIYVATFNGLAVGDTNDVLSGWTVYGSTDGLASNDTSSVNATGDSIYVASFDSLSYSLDGGASWNIDDTSFTTTNGIRDFASDGTFVYAAEDGKVWVSVIGRSDWTELTTDLPSDEVVSSLSVDGTSIYVGTGSSGVYSATIESGSGK